MSPDQRVAKSYVWYGGKCFFVSTIERDSSAMADPIRYNETIAWDFDWDTQKRGKQVAMGEAPQDSIKTHQKFVDQLHAIGQVPDED